MKNLSLFDLPELDSDLRRPGSEFEVISIPDGELHYAPGFLSPSAADTTNATISATSADAHLAAIIADTPWQQSQLYIAGRPCLIPRLNAWYGDECTHYGYSGMRLALNPWTPRLSALRQQVEKAVGTGFNSALLNYYRSGSDSVDWHSDDEPELGANPVIAALSLGAERRFDLRHKTQKHLRYQLELEHGSLLVMAGSMQRYWAHRIAKTTDHCPARVSITFRQVIKR